MLSHHETRLEELSANGSQTTGLGIQPFQNSLKTFIFRHLDQSTDHNLLTYFLTYFSCVVLCHRFSSQHLLAVQPAIVDHSYAGGFRRRSRHAAAGPRTQKCPSCGL